MIYLNNNQYTTAAIATVGALGGAYLAYYIYRESNQRKLPEEWYQVGTISNIYIYPIKSCRPTILNKAECSILGPRDGWLRDRILMVVDDKNNFITARVFSQLYLVQPTVKNSILTLHHKDMEPASVNLAEIIAMQPTTKATVWSTTVPVYDCGQLASEWFCRLLDGKPNSFKLMYYASQNPRTLKPHAEHKFFKFTKKDTGVFQDEVSFHLINEASVDELNSRLQGDTQVTHRHFRPNFVVSGAKAYDEDNWKYVKIGENIFEIIKPCLRCLMTTIDPETGLRSPKTEPLETLRKYRQIEDPVIRKSAGSAPRMGLEMALRSGPGDIVYMNEPVYVSY